MKLTGASHARVQKAQAVREKLEQLGIAEQDVEDAVAWARR